MSSPRPWQVLARLPAWQITEIPRSGETPVARDAGLAQRVQALASAYGSGAPLALAWMRDRPGGPVRVLTAGPAIPGGCDAGQVVLTLPAGARAVPLEAGAAAHTLDAVPCWTGVAAVTDVVLADDDGPAGPGELATAPSLEDALLSVWPGAFAWLLFAEPASRDTISDLAAEAAREQLAAQQYSTPRATLAARRAGSRFNGLRKAAATGLWRLHLLAGGATADDAVRVAQMLCASADVRGLPYSLSVVAGTGSLPDMLAAGTDPGERKKALVRERERAAALALERDRTWWNTPIGDSYPRPGNGAQSYRQDTVPAVQYPGDDQDEPVPESPFYAPARLVAALARGPAREVPGIRFTLRPQFDVTPETRPSGSGASGVLAGTILDSNRIPAGPLDVPLSSLNRHVFVTGATGAGKSQTVRNLLEQATHVGIPWLVVEPAKAEYRLMAARLPEAEVIRIRPGDLDLPAAGINPLEPALGPGETRFPLQTHADLLRSLFLAAFEADEPFPQVIAAALTRCYEAAGWDLVTGQPAMPGVQPAYPGLEDLQSAAMSVVDEIGYGREVADNVRGFVAVRIGSLRFGTAGRFLDGAHPLDFGKLLTSNAVLEIEDAGDDRDKAFLMGAVLIRLTEHLRLVQRHEDVPAAGLRHLTVFEEAHRLLRQAPPGAANGAAAHATEMFADLLAEIRAYGEGLVIAEQIPGKLIPDVIKNTAIKLVHRLPAADDRAVVGATMNLTDHQSQYLVTLPPGEAAAHCDGMDFPVLIRTSDGTSREAARPAVTVSPEPVIGRWSTTCGTDCMDRACTLAQVNNARRVTVIEPRLVMWAELAVVAHLTGWEMPRPRPSFSARLSSVEPRVLDCAISHAVHAAVAARVPVISSRISPGELAVHVAAMMRKTLTPEGVTCARREPDYLAPSFRWALVRADLKTATGGRHPDSDAWERSYGEPVPGQTAAQQYRVIHQRYLLDQADTRTAAKVIWGTRPHPAIEQAAGARASSDQWPARLHQILAAFATTQWPGKLLQRAPAYREEAVS